MTVRSLLMLIACMPAILVALIACKPADPGSGQRNRLTGRVVDTETNAPIKGAIVTIDGGSVVVTGDDGVFEIGPSVKKVAARSYGYTRDEAVLAVDAKAPVELRLRTIRPKALYLTYYGIGTRDLRGAAMKLLEETELNSLVIDVKGDRGIITYKSEVPLVSEIGAQKPIVKDIRGLLQSMKEKGIYTIARIVVFKDDVLGSARPDLAVKSPDGKTWRDREGLIWVDPSLKEVRDYNIALAVEAAGQGFDEIQFDYIRFPDHKGLVFSLPDTEENRVNAIMSFITEAYGRLAPYNVFLAADVFGYVAWNLNDTHIGQKLDQLALHVDYISLMLYPSGFHYGIPGYRNPVANPNKIVYLTLKRAQERTGLPPVRFRPWLQAFRDYAFDRRHFTGTEIRGQIRAAEEFGAGGWMLWNPRNVYTADGLEKE